RWLPRKTPSHPLKRGKRWHGRVSAALFWALRASLRTNCRDDKDAMGKSQARLWGAQIGTDGFSSFFNYMRIIWRYSQQHHVTVISWVVVCQITGMRIIGREFFIGDDCAFGVQLLFQGLRYAFQIQ